MTIKCINKAILFFCSHLFCKSPPSFIVIARLALFSVAEDKTPAAAKNIFNGDSCQRTYHASCSICEHMTGYTQESSISYVKFTEGSYATITAVTAYRDSMSGCWGPRSHERAEEFPRNSRVSIQVACTRPLGIIEPHSRMDGHISSICCFIKRNKKKKEKIQGYLTHNWSQGVGAEFCH